MNNQSSFFAVIFLLLFFTTILTNCNSSKATQQVVEEVETVEDDAPKPIVVDLKGSVHPSVVIAGLQKYELEAVEQIDKKMNQWIFIYNPEVVTADEILKVLKYEQWMEDAWFYVE